MDKSERRARQRTENIGRAREMHQARLAYESELPLLTEKKNKYSKYNIGCSGWYYFDWAEGFYKGIERKNWFDHYSDEFDTVELNAPFYSWPKIATVKTWLRQIGKKNFVYTVKVSELITHVKRFTGTKELVKDFCYIADLLGDKMGCFLFQLPPSYHYTPARLKSILSQLDLSRKNVVEFRHPTWWNEQVYSAFRKTGIIFCSCSAPKLPDELIKTSDDIYIRFHGLEKWYRHDYSKEELRKWAGRIKASEAKHIWVYFNNDYNGFAIKNAKSLAKILC